MRKPIATALFVITVAASAQAQNTATVTPQNAPPSPKNITITLTEQEANVLEQMLDQAVKAIGLRAAEAGVVLNRKLQAARNGTPPATAQVVPADPPKKE